MDVYDPTTLGVFQSVAAERRRQNRKWGQQDHDFGSWLEIFQEELGEACRARMEARYRPGHLHDKEVKGSILLSGLPEGSQATYSNYAGSVQEQRADFRKELVESIAVLVAAVECGDRRGWFR